MSNSRRLLAYLALFIAAIVWGIAFVPQRISAQYTGALTFNAIRFLGGAVLVGLFLGRRRLRSIGAQELRASLLLGCLLFVGAAFQQLGMLTTTAGKGGFITGLYIVFVPIALALIWKERIKVSGWLGALIALIGMGLLSLTGDLALASGDLWVLLCAFAFTFHVIAVGKKTQSLDPLLLSVGQYFVCGILSFFGAALLERETWATTSQATLPLLYMIVFSIGLGYTFQVVAQKYVPSSNASLIMSLESVFAAIAGWAILSEELSAQQVCGCVLMFVGMLVAQMEDLKAGFSR